jgi:signal transduction histidine kinase
LAAAAVLVAALVAPVAVGIGERHRADARTAAASFAAAMSAVRTILDEDRRALDRLVQSAQDQPGAFMPPLTPGLHAAALFDASGTSVAAIDAGGKGMTIATLLEAAAGEIAAHPEERLAIIPGIADDDGGDQLAALARPWVGAGGLSGGIAVVVLGRDAFSALDRLQGATFGGRFDVVTTDGAPLFGGSNAAVVGALQQPIADTPLLLRYVPRRSASVRLWRATAPFLSIAFAGLIAAASLAVGLGRRGRWLHREIARRTAVGHRLRRELATIAATVGRDNEANTAKSQFFAQITHELRTPLNAILGFSETIRQEMFGPLANPRYREYAGLIHDAGSHLLSLTNDLLDSARLQSGKMRIAPIRVSAAALARSALDIVEVIAAQGHIELTSTVLPGCPDLNVDPRAVKQILINLLSNAIKYTPRGGRIELQFAARAVGGVTIEITDTGAGMSREEALYAFEPFGRTGAKARRQPGTGLGLSLARSLARLHGGDLTLASRLGAGTTAIVTRPESAVFATPNAAASHGHPAKSGPDSTAARAA